MDSYLSHLECTYCSRTYQASRPHRTCLECGKVLYARYDLERASKDITPKVFRTREASLWRYFELLPVREKDNIITLGEGFTPLLPARNLARLLNLPSIYIKDEGMNPTGSFKARGLAVAVSKAKELGITKVVLPSAGNAAGALAAYCARGNIEATVFMPRDVPLANAEESRAYGARIILVDGLIGDAGRLSAEAAEKEDLFDMSTLKEPYRVEGKKTMGYEIAEQLGWQLPDVIVYPTGGGTGLVGMWKAFDEMMAMGWLSGRKPRMVCVQAEGCAPIVQAFEQGNEFATPWPDATTLAAGIRVPSAIGDYLILRAIRESNGIAVSVSEKEILNAVREISALEGIFPAPEGAATLAGLRRLLDQGWVSGTETIVLMNTGTALKYLDMLKE